MTFNFQVYKTDEFTREFSQLPDNVQRRLDTAVQEILFQRPYESKALKGNKKGKRSLRVGDYRIIFAICEECKQKNFTQLNGCSDCRKHGRNDIIMFTCGHRADVYEEY